MSWARARIALFCYFSRDFCIIMANISTKQNTSYSEDVSVAKEQLQKCLQRLKVAKDDNEKLACLLLFTHLMKNNVSLSVDSSEIFEAIGAGFIVRLLNSKSVPQGCPWFIYKALALNILASFTDKELFHPLIVSNLHIIADILSSNQNNPETSEIYGDAIKIFLVFSRTQKGCEHFLETVCIPVILQHLLENPDMDSLFEILRGILIHVPRQIWEENAIGLKNLLEIFAKTFAESQELNKFSISEKILCILQSLCDSKMAVSHEQEMGEHSQNNCEKFEITNKDWADNLKKGVRDILQSRCKIKYKYIALQLASCLIELLGTEWALESRDKHLDLSNTKFWYILLSIVKTELKMILENGNFNEIQEQSTVLVASYKILEKTIEFLIADKNDSWFLSDELILKIHGILVDCFSCIIEFLLHVGTTTDNANEIPCCYRRPIVIATVRVLCSWLSEETNSLSEKVSKILPILLDWAKASLDEGNVSEATHKKLPEEIISYLLPPLCHFSADETFCSILIQKEIHITLIHYFDQVWQNQENTIESPSLITLCNVFLNFCVLQTDLIKSEPNFHKILDTIMLSLPKIVDQSNLVVLTAHFTLLGLMLFRHRSCTDRVTLTGDQESFLKGTIHFLKRAQISLNTNSNPNEINSSFQKEWDEISELWFLSLQNLIACAKLVAPVKNILEASGWINETKNWLDKCENLVELTPTLASIADID